MNVEQNNRGVSVSGEAIVFNNLLSTGTVVGTSVVVTAKLPTASEAVDRENAQGDLRSIKDVSEAAALGRGSASVLTEIINI